MFKENLKMFIKVHEFTDGTVRADLSFGNWGKITVCSGFYLDDTIDRINDFLDDATRALNELNAAAAIKP